ncbi:DUF1345 domain-containing protein [Agrococcus sp. SGAir0287]|uniref:DUF1345 domain-containing protein n=1 Tax=Agrococcus sp. SGAir0287 TaxID=2070347 RepID=UPI0010CD41D8|nr:DUF1345 domain-containing protein [Agrococcus sp. SGAir0287]QCR18257.1 hypothetical protein C1N71_01325 [Agrococcus sp. SGAir0287]
MATNRRPRGPAGARRPGDSRPTTGLDRPSTRPSHPSERSRRIRHRLHDEALRHTLSISVSGILIALLVAVVAIAVGGRIEYADTLLVSMTLVFAVYGPLFLLLTHLAFGHLHGSRLREHLRRSTERRRLVRLLFLGGPKSWAGLIVTIGLSAVLLLATGGARDSLWLVAACVACVIGTWVLLVGVFAAEYMRAWANDDSLQFPGGDDLRLADFVYVSVQLSTTFSASDVNLVATSARRLATVHSIVAFAYSTVIVAVFASLLISSAQ